MATLPSPSVTAEQYLEHDRNAEESGEYIFGEIVPVNAVMPTHALISARVLAAFSNRLAGTPCNVFNTGLRVSLDPKKGYVYPDLTVVCGQPQYLDAKKDTITNPKIVVEVLSPGTMKNDLGPKADSTGKQNLSRISSSSNRPASKIEYWFRLPTGRWDHTVLESVQEILKLESVNCEIPVSEIYAGVELPPSEIAQ